MLDKASPLNDVSFWPVLGICSVRSMSFFIIILIGPSEISGNKVLLVSIGSGAPPEYLFMIAATLNPVNNGTPKCP